MPIVIKSYSVHHAISYLTYLTHMTYLTYIWLAAAKIREQKKLPHNSDSSFQVSFHMSVVSH